MNLKSRGLSGNSYIVYKYFREDRDSAMTAARDAVACGRSRKENQRKLWKLLEISGKI